MWQRIWYYRYLYYIKYIIYIDRTSYKLKTKTLYLENLSDRYEIS